MLAVIHKHTDIIKHLLFEAKADPNIAREDVSNFMHDNSVMHACDINSHTLQDGFTALKWAAQYVLTDVLEYLIEAGADVNKHYGVQLLCIIVAYNYIFLYIYNIIGMDCPYVCCLSCNSRGDWHPY